MTPLPQGTPWTRISTGDEGDADEGEVGLSCRNVRPEKTQLPLAREADQAETPATGPRRHLTPRRPPSVCYF